MNHNTLRCAMVAVLVMFAAASAFGQGMRMSPEDRAKILKDSLSLDSAQTVKVTTILKEQQAAMQDMFQSGGGDREAMRSAMMDMRAKTDAKIKAVLNDTQKKKYEQMMQNRPPMGGGRMRGGN